MKKYDYYLKVIKETQSKKVREKGKEIPAGDWQGKSYSHILPLDGEKNTKKARIDAINKYLGVRLDNKKGLPHQYAHHLNSSQLLCYMAFRPLLTVDYKPSADLIELLKSLEINISMDAQCEFEYDDNLEWEQKHEPEGTSFDFHISDGNHEYFFEIKFTEDGFGKAKADDKHKEKFNDIYRDKINEVINKEVTVEECMKYYQLFRNIIRGVSDSKTIVFITDANNPATTKEFKEFKDKYLDNSKVNILPLTWQELNKNWPETVLKPFQFVCFEPDFNPQDLPIL